MKKKCTFFLEASNVLPLPHIGIYIILSAAAIVIGDYYNVITVALNSVPSIILWVSAVAVFSALVLWIWNNKIIDLFKVKVVNFLDIIILIACGTMLLIAIYWSIFGCFGTVKFWIAVLLFIILCLLLIVRSHKTRSAPENNTTTCGKLLDLKDIFDCDTPFPVRTPILLAERDISYDLLNRKAIINQLIYSIVNCQCNDSFVVGLEGAWGSGKTTILNLVKEELCQKYSGEISVIDEFDPWMLGSQEAIMLALYDTILKKAGINYSVSRSKRVANSLRATVSSISEATNLLQNVTSYEKNDYEKAIDLKETISSYLLKSDKRYVIFLDNIDRTSSENVLFLFKLISTFFRLPKIVYVLAYDKDRINAILNEDKTIDSHYLDKIVQVAIQVPEITDVQRNSVYAKCIESLLLNAGISIEEIPQYNVVYKAIVENAKDLRTFKRMLNTAYNSAFMLEHSLCKRELFSLEIIHFLAPSLYSKIYENREYFISHDRLQDTGSSRLVFDKKKFNSEGNAFFSELETQYSSYFSLLSDLFPYVERYMKKVELEPEYHYNDKESYHEILKRMSICSGKFFNLYFSFSDNHFSELNNTVICLVSELNSVEKASDVGNRINTLLEIIPRNSQREWVELLEVYITDVNSNRLLSVAISLADSFYRIDNRREFLMLSARERVPVIIARILALISDADFTEFLHHFSGSYSNLSLLERITYWLNCSNTNTQLAEERSKKTKELWEGLCADVLNNTIDIYVDGIYHQNNSAGLFHYVSDSDVRKDLLKNYCSCIASETNVYRFLGDMLNTSHGVGYGYSFSEKTFSDLGNIESKIDQILLKRKPQNESEAFIQKVYEQYKAKIKNGFGKYGITVSEEMQFSL